MTETVHAGMRLAMKTSLRILLAAGRGNLQHTA